MTAPYYPFDRTIRQSDVLSGDGSTTVFGPSSFKIASIDDVEVWRKDILEETFSLDEAATVTKTGSGFSTFTVTFDTAPPATTDFYYQSRRLHERSTAISKAQRLDVEALDLELTRIGTILQENYREIGAAVKAEPGISPPRISEALLPGKLVEVSAFGSLVNGPAYADLVTLKNLVAALVSSAVAQGSVPIYATTLAVQSLQVPGGLAAFQSNGHSAVGDNGGATWRRVASQPVHPGRIRSADRYLPDGTISASNGGWWEIVGPTLPVEAFGAAGDCPDVSAIDPTDQAAIIALVTAATNDAAAFQKAFQCAHSQGGGVVTYGFGKRYRVAYSPTGTHALVMGEHTTLKQIGGGWLEPDPTLITGAKPAGSPPANKGFPDPGITLGDPYTGYQTQVPSGFLTAGNIVLAEAGITEADFVHNSYAEDVQIRCHIRTYWHQLADQSSPYRRLRMYGLHFRWGIGCGYRGKCHVEGTPNNGFYTFGGRDFIATGLSAERCGYGAVLGTAQNSFSFNGIVVVGNKDLSSQNFQISEVFSRFAKDECLSYANVRPIFISRVTSTGDHDRAVEGDASFRASTDSATLGFEVGGEVLIDGVIQDGRHDVTTGTIGAGSTSLTVADAFMLAADGSNGRYLYITGAGAGGGDGPFLIASVNYTTNVVTLDASTPTTFAVTDALVYVQGRAVVTASDGNEGRATIRNIRARNVRAVYPPISFSASDGGRVTIEDALLENVVVPTNSHGVLVEAEHVRVRNIGFIGSDGGVNSAIVQAKARDVEIDTLSADTGFAYGARLSEHNGLATRAVVRGMRPAGLKLAAVRLDYSIKCPTIEIIDNAPLGINSNADENMGFVTVGNAGCAWDWLTVSGNRCRHAGRTTAVLTFANGISATAGAGGVGRICRNDFFDPDYLVFNEFADPRCYNNASGLFTDYGEFDNDVPGMRLVSVTAEPSSGRHFKGDRYHVRYPGGGTPAVYVCTRGGRFDTLTGVTGSIGSGSRTLTVSSGSGLKPWDYITIAGVSGTKRVVWRDGTTVTIDIPADAPVSDVAIAYQTPTYKAINLEA
jgi:hypothetical protein